MNEQLIEVLTDINGWVRGINLDLTLLIIILFFMLVFKDMGKK